MRRQPGSAGWTDLVSVLLLAAWFAYLLLAPTVGFGWIGSWHNEQRAAQIALLAATALGFWAMALDRRYRLRLPRIHGIVVAVFALGAISAARAKYVDAAYAEVALHFLLLILIVVTAQAIARNPGRALALAQYGALMLLGAYALGVGVRYGAAVSLQRALDLDVLLLGYANPRFPSALHALLIPFVAGLSADPRQRRAVRVVGFIVLACIWAINLALATRAIWFAYAVSLPLLWIWLGRRALSPLALAVTASAFAGALLYALVFRGLPVWIGIGESFQTRTLDQLASGSNRHLLVRSSLEAIGSAPWLGIGPMQFGAIPNVWSAHPHNWVLQLASEWGLPATALALVGTFVLFRRFGQAVADRPSQAEAAIPFVAASVVAIVYGLVDGNLVMPISQTAAALVLGGAIGALRLPGAQGAAGHHVWSLRWALVTIALAAISAGHLAWFSVNTLGSATSEESTFSRTLWPRFWSDGFLPLKGR
jgi:putative inorganic carbon (HCO3(-)) transporter